MELNPFRPEPVEEHAQGQQHTPQLDEGYMSPVDLSPMNTTLLMKI